MPQARSGKVSRMRRLLTRADRSKKQSLNDLRDEINKIGLPDAALKPVPLLNNGHFPITHL